MELYTQHKAVLHRVLPESFLGVSVLGETFIFLEITSLFDVMTSIGLFYGWGALSDEINKTMSPDNPKAFANQHGTFLGVIVLILLTGPMPFVHHIISLKVVSEFQVHLLGVILLPIGLVLGGISLRYRLLWLLYLGCALTCGVACLFIFCRIVFNHQLWFNHIGLKDLGSGLFGFFIGMWTVFFFVISVPLGELLSTENVFYVYALLAIVLAIWPLKSINEADLENSASARGAALASDLNSDALCAGALEEKNINRKAYDSQDLEMMKTTTIPQRNDKLGDQKQLTADSTEHESSEPSPANRDPHTWTPKPSLALTLSSTSTNEVDSEAFPLSVAQILSTQQVWLLIVFQAVMLTPGWGIKLAAFSIIQNLFDVSREYASIIASVYVSCYAIGRFFAGVMSQQFGAIRAFDAILSSMFVLLMLLPVPLRLLPHSFIQDSGCILFSTMICLIGVLYGGGQALFYCLVFDVYGGTNYKIGFSLCSSGFAVAVIVGGLSSAYSFSGSETGEAALSLAESWFYVMGGCTLLGLLMLHALTPFDYRAAREAAARYSPGATGDAGEVETNVPTEAKRSVRVEGEGRCGGGGVEAKGQSRRPAFLSRKAMTRLISGRYL